MEIVDISGCQCAQSLVVVGRADEHFVEHSCQVGAETQVVEAGEVMAAGGFVVLVLSGRYCVVSMG